MESAADEMAYLRASRTIFSSESAGTNRDKRSVTKPISDPVPCRRRHGLCPITILRFPRCLDHRTASIFAKPSVPPEFYPLPDRLCLLKEGTEDVRLI